MPLRDDIIDLIFKIIKRPAIYCGSPEASHGMAVALLSILHSIVTGISVTESVLFLLDKTQKINSEAVRHQSVAVLLCDNPSTCEERVSYEAFQKNTNKLLDIILSDEGYKKEDGAS